VELGELGEGVVAGDIGVEDEEGRVVLAQNALGELEGAGGAEGLGLDGELYIDVVLLLILHGQLVYALLRLGRCTNCLQRLSHDLWAVVDGEDDISDTRSGQCLDLVLNHGLVRELHERLRVGERLRLASVVPFSVKRVVGGERHTKGRRRVPNPPTRMMAALHVSLAPCSNYVC
jgi:hypothetical protein